MGLHPLVATLLVNMNFMVVRTDGNFCGGGGEREREGKNVNMLDLELTNKLDQFLVSAKQQAGQLKCLS